jgi:hypothetical protein
MIAMTTSSSISVNPLRLVAFDPRGLALLGPPIEPAGRSPARHPGPEDRPLLRQILSSWILSMTPPHQSNPISPLSKNSLDHSKNQSEYVKKIFLDSQNFGHG